MKKNIFLLIVLSGVFLQKPLAQPFMWADSIKGTYNGQYLNSNIYSPNGCGIATDNLENIYAVNSAFNISTLYKYNPNGILQWNKSGKTMNGVAADNDGHCYVCGYYFFQKYNNSGLLIHKDSATGSDGSSVSCNAITYDGGKYLYVTGTWSADGTAIFGSQMISGASNNSSPSLFILKCDTTGNVIWVKSSKGRRTGASECCGLGINIASNGFIYVSGYFADSVILGADSLNSTQSISIGFLACYDSSGNVHWVRGVNRSYSSCYSVSSDGVGNAYITGCAGNFPNAVNCFIAKYRSNGDSVWWRETNGANQNIDAWGFGISTNSSGISFITGGIEGTLSFGNILFTAKNWSDIFMVKYDSSGNAIWGYDPMCKYFDSYDNYGLAVTTDKEGCNFYFTGFLMTAQKFGNTIIYDYPERGQFYVTKFDSGCVLTDIQTLTELREPVKIYPNPFSNFTTILFNEIGIHQLEVEDITGRILQRIECTGQQYELQRGSLSEGMYFIKVTDGQNNVSVSKILIE